MLRSATEMPTFLAPATLALPAAATPPVWRFFFLTSTRRDLEGIAYRGLRPAQAAPVPPGEACSVKASLASLPPLRPRQRMRGPGTRQYTPAPPALCPTGEIPIVIAAAGVSAGTPSLADIPRNVDNDDAIRLSPPARGLVPFPSPFPDPATAVPLTAPLASPPWRIRIPAVESAPVQAALRASDMIDAIPAAAECPPCPSAFENAAPFHFRVSQEASRAQRAKPALILGAVSSSHTPLPGPVTAIPSANAVRPRQRMRGPGARQHTPAPATLRSWGPAADSFLGPAPGPLAAQKIAASCPIWLALSVALPSRPQSAGLPAPLSPETAQLSSLFTAVGSAAGLLDLPTQLIRTGPCQAITTTPFALWRSSPVLPSGFAALPGAHCIPVAPRIGQEKRRPPLPQPCIPAAVRTESPLFRPTPHLTPGVRIAAAIENCRPAADETEAAAAAGFLNETPAAVPGSSSSVLDSAEFPLYPVWLPALFSLWKPLVRLRPSRGMNPSEADAAESGCDEVRLAEGPGFFGLLSFPGAPKPAGVPPVKAPPAESTPAPATVALPPGPSALQKTIDAWRAAPRVARFMAIAIPFMIPALLLGPKIGANLSFQIPSSNWGAVTTAIKERSTVDIQEDFRSGLGGWTGPADWQSTWSTDGSGSVQPGHLALLRATVPLRDYHLEFQSYVSSKALGFVFRAQDMNNYYATQINVKKPGPLPTVTLVRYAVIGGREEARQEMSIPLYLREDTLYKVVVAVEGEHFATTINGQIVDAWSDGRLKSGGVGLFADKGAVAHVRSIRVVDHEDFIGWVCSQVSQWTVDRRTLGVKHE